MHVGLPPRQAQRPRRCPAQVESRGILTGLRRAVSVVQPIVVTVEIHRPGLSPKLAAGRDELLGALVACLVRALLAHPLEVVLDAARHDVDVDTALGYLVQRRRHLGKQAERYETGPDSDQEADAAGNRCQRRRCGPRLGQRRIFGKQTVGKPRWYQQRVVATLFSGLHHPSQVIEVRRPIRPHRPRTAAVAVDGDEPAESHSVRTVVHGRSRTFGSCSDFGWMLTGAPGPQQRAVPPPADTTSPSQSRQPRCSSCRPEPTT